MIFKRDTGTLLCLWPQKTVGLSHLVLPHQAQLQIVYNKKTQTGKAGRIIRPK